MLIDKDVMWVTSMKSAPPATLFVSRSTRAQQKTGTEAEAALLPVCRRRNYPTSHHITPSAKLNMAVRLLFSSSIYQRVVVATRWGRSLTKCFRSTNSFSNHEECGCVGDLLISLCFESLFILPCIVLSRLLMEKHNMRDSRMP